MCQYNMETSRKKFKINFKFRLKQDVSIRESDTYENVKESIILSRRFLSVFVLIFWGFVYIFMAKK